MNPLVPTSVDVMLSLLAVAVAVYALVALVSVLRSGSVSGMRELAWVLLVLFVPVAGPTLWFMMGPRRRPAIAGSD